MNKHARQFGRDRVDDPRDQGYLIDAPRPRRRSRNWKLNGWYGDQLDLPECVGFAGATLLHSSPFKQWLDPHGLYRLAQQNDEWEGEDYDGTSVRGLMRVLAMLGLIDEYRWTWDAAQCAAWVLEVSPMIVGTACYEGMAEPNDAGLMSLDGDDLGGHAYTLLGYNARTELFRVWFNWGRAWSVNGFAYLSLAQLQNLLDEDGAEACAAIERRASPE